MNALLSGSKFALAATLAVAASVGCAGHAGTSIELVEGLDSAPRDRDRASRGPAFEVRGLDDKTTKQLSRDGPDAWHGLFRVYVEGPSSPPPMLGSYELSGGVLRFRPRFSLTPGVSYRAVFDGSRLVPTERVREQVERVFTIPELQVEPKAFVTQVYPSANVLPENLLKFYIHFSHAMSQGEAYDLVRLVDAGGREVAHPFLELGEELWDRDGRRFTLFFDPGRVKRELRPRELVGPALRRGQAYTLVVRASWLDADGQPLKNEFRKSFRVVAPDVEQPDPKTWKLAPPSARTRELLTVDFPDPLDHALLHRMLWITDESGQEVDGEITVSAGETRWTFRPQRPWQAGNYRLVVDTTIEDRAGNSIQAPFEVDLVGGTARRLEIKTTSIAFRVD